MVRVAGVRCLYSLARCQSLVGWREWVDPRSLPVEVAQRRRSLAGTWLVGNLGGCLVNVVVSPEHDIQGVVRVEDDSLAAAGWALWLQRSHLLGAGRGGSCPGHSRCWRSGCPWGGVLLEVQEVLLRNEAI